MRKSGQIFFFFVVYIVASGPKKFREKKNLENRTIFKAAYWGT